MKHVMQQQLQSIMQKGKWHYIIVHGMLCWGLGTAVLFSLLMFFFNEQPFWNTLLKSLIMFPLGGIVWGSIMWNIIIRAVASKTR